MSTTTAPALQRGLFIAGETRPLADATLEITNPATGELVGHATRADPAGVDEAVRAAQDAFAEWSARSYSERGEVLHAGAEAFAAHVEELVPILVAEQGKTIREAKIELRKAADTLEHYAGMRREVRGVYVNGLDPGVEGRVLRKPLGVVAAIVPWNFPTTLLCNKLGPGLLCGNTFVAKPADTTPFTTLRLAEILSQAGLPPGVLNVVTGTGPRRARRSSPIRWCARSPSPGPRRPESASPRWPGSKRVTLELGGSDPMIICDDADPVAASATAWAKLTTAVRRASSETVVRVQAGGRRGRRGDRRQRVAAGAGSDPGSQIRPCTRAASWRSLRARVNDSVAGGQLLVGGAALIFRGSRGHFYSPDAGARATARRWDGPGSEVFGPALPIWRVKDLDEALELANDSPSVCGSRWDNRPGAFRARPRSSTAVATRGSIRRPRSTTSCRSAASRPAASARSTARRRLTSTPTASPLSSAGRTEMVTATMGDRGSNVGEIVDRRVEEGLAEKVAYIAADATLTYEALRRQINRAAGLLRELGVRREQRVLLVLDDTTVFPIVFLAAMKLGAVPVPVSVLDKEENFRHYVADTHTELVVTDAGCLPRLRGALEDSGVRFVARAGDGPGVTELDEALAAQAPELDPVAVHRDDMAFWLYSSGSTGKPKGVVHLHHDIEVTCENYARQVLGITGEDVTFSTTKLFHAYGLGNGLSFPLWFGATSVLMTGPTKPESILHTLRTHRPTVFYSVPALFGALVREPAADGALDSVRVCASAAEPLPGPTVLRWRERFGLDIMDGIGSTEMLHIFCSIWLGELEPGTRRAARARLGRAAVGRRGRGGAHRTRRVWGLEVLRRLVWRSTGISTRGAHSMRASGLPPATATSAARTAPMPTSGDWTMAALKVGGLWVSPIDMEFVPMEHPRVRGVGAGVTIHDVSRIAAFVEIADEPEDTGDDALADELRDFCKERLRRYEYPHVVHFVDELPRTLTGKVQRASPCATRSLSPTLEPAVRAEAPANSVIAASTSPGCSRCGPWPPGSTSRVTGPRTAPVMRSTWASVP